MKTEIRRVKTCKVSEKGADKGIEKGRGEETPHPMPLAHSGQSTGHVGGEEDNPCTI